MWFSGRYITDVALAIDSTHREMEEDLGVMMNTWTRYIRLMADTQEPQTEINQQLKLVVDYRNLVRNIKVKHINTFKQIEEELQPKNVQQHQTEIHVRSKLRSTNLTTNGSLNVHRIPLGCSCLMTTTLPEAILPFTANTVLWGKGYWVSDNQATL